jgi:hypothetical protein
MHSDGRDHMCWSIVNTTEYQNPLTFGKLREWMAYEHSKSPPSAAATTASPCCCYCCWSGLTMVMPTQVQEQDRPLTVSNHV